MSKKKAKPKRNPEQTQISVSLEKELHRNYQAILILTLFLGWTFLGWVAALIWAVYKPRGK